MNLKSKKYFVYDFDETIDHIQIDWSDHRLGVEAAIKKVIPSFKYGDFSVSSFKVRNDAVKKYGLKVKLALDDFQAKFEKDHYSGHIPNQELIAFIKKNSKNKEIKQFLWTSNHSKTVEPLLKELKIDHLFEIVITKDRAQLLKPDPDGFSKIYIKDTDLSEYLMIGDNSLTDGDAAETAGFDYIHVDEFMKLT